MWTCWHHPDMPELHGWSHCCSDQKSRNVWYTLTHNFFHCGGLCTIHSGEHCESTLCLPSFSPPSPSFIYYLDLCLFRYIYTYLHMFAQYLPHLSEFHSTLCFVPGIYPKHSILRFIFSPPFPSLTHHLFFIQIKHYSTNIILLFQTYEHAHFWASAPLGQGRSLLSVYP